MIDRLREWGFPIGLLLAWAIAAVFTVSALVGMEATVERNQAPPQSMHTVARSPATQGPTAAPHS
jgi:hypothetical protein